MSYLCYRCVRARGTSAPYAVTLFHGTALCANCARDITEATPVVEPVKATPAAPKATKSGTVTARKPSGRSGS